MISLEPSFPTNLTDVARVASIYFHIALYAFQPNQSRLCFSIIIYNCLVEIELHREIYHFTHERQTLKLDSNQHSAISRSFYHLNYLSDEV